MKVEESGKKWIKVVDKWIKMWITCDYPSTDPKSEGDVDVHGRI
jgi:hypothetical protein